MTTMLRSRRQFVTYSAAAGAALTLRQPWSAFGAETARPPLFHISLAQWSLHRALQNGMDNLDFAPFTKKEFGIDAVEYVNQFFKDKANDTNYLREMKQRADDAGVRSLLIMCDGEGDLGDPDESQRSKAIENHFRWIEAAKFLGGHAIRVNAKSSGSYGDQQRLAADGLSRLAEFAAQHGLDVIVENHGGLSSNGKWLSGVMERVNMRNCGTLPDFGNFSEYDRYQGVQDLMPYAAAVSAKSHEFNDAGDEVRTNYYRMMQIVLKAGYHGYVGIEYEGDKHSEVEGIHLTKRLLERIRNAFS